MSILTSDDHNKVTTFIKKLMKFNVFISLITYLAGWSFFVYLIHEPQKTSFHDNSLLPGLASREFVAVNQAEHLVHQLANLSAEFPEKYFPVNFLRKQFEDIGLEVYEHKFQFKYPFGYEQSTVDGLNLYAIFRAPRAASTESIVISAPYRSPSNPNGSTLPSIALMYSLAKFFKTKNYWAKDIIYLISGNELLGIQAWLQSYQGLENRFGQYLESDVLLGKAGAIQAALNLELQSFSPPYVQVKLEGLNGQLPNLDLFNVAVELCNREAVPVLYHGESFYMMENEWENWKRKARTMISMMVTQATMLPTGAHGLFQKYAISAITLEAPDRRAKYVMVNGLQLGRSIEGIVRSLNNMMEKFNRSFYFYLLASTRRFISISSYMIVFGLMAFPLACRSLFYYFQISNRQQITTIDNNFDFWNSFKPCVLAHLFGLLAIGIVSLVLTRLSIFDMILYDIPVEILTFSIFIILAIISLNLPALWTALPKKSSNQYNLQSMVTLLNTLLLLTSISLINISLAIALASIYVPLLSIFSIQDHHRSTENSTWLQRLCNFIKSMILLLIHPITLHLICLFGLSISMDPDLNSLHKLSFNDWPSLLLKHLKRSFRSQPRTMMNFIEDWYLFDNWAFPIISLFLYPVWLQLWFQSFTTVV
ncbi:glycosylphosphatidylinositol anchor attachment 1 [Dermatophagoides pteronyssinus]|uniref:glycosylphosphatidylinositol anchor attachment 1 n=1 Tax=Dermatophagoides pteronyssinus TaxID=6956 RepID=UPI003F67D08F